MVKSQDIKKVLRNLADPAIAEHSARFFKTGKGEYGEGDRFLGIRVPVLREQVRKFESISIREVQHLLTSSFHEDRLCALLLLVRKYAKGTERERTDIYELYLKNTKYINNWDLVDSSAHHIVGTYLEHRDRQLLYHLVESTSLWERRIAIMSTFHFIRKNEFDDTLNLSKRLINDTEDLIHKAVGWMLREIGKRDLGVEEVFLKAYYQNMPRTMLRYAIERFPEHRRKQYLNGEV